jgi:hypothetical protein
VGHRVLAGLIVMAAIGAVTMLFQGDTGDLVREEFPAQFIKDPEKATLFSVVDSGLAGLSSTPMRHEEMADDFLSLGLSDTQGEQAPEESFTSGTASTVSAEDITVKTANGVVQLQNYLKKVEGQLAQEAIARQAGLAEMKGLVEKYKQYNEGARKKLEKALRAKMEINAKAAKDSVVAAMKSASEALAKEANASTKRAKLAAEDRAKIRKELSAERSKAEENLKLAVASWTKSQAALASETNAKITKLNKHVAANAALIKANAAAAQNGINKLTAGFTKQLEAAKADTSKSITALGATVAAANQRTRQWVQSKVGALVALEAARFQRERERMADRRHVMDLQLTHSAARLQACLNAARALQDPSFARTVKNIDSVKASAQRLAGAAATEFKMSIAALGAVVRQQTAELDIAKGEAQGAMPKGVLLGAKVNEVTLAELKRLIHVAGGKYTALKRGNKELRKLLHQKKAVTSADLTHMAQGFHEQLEALRSAASKSTQPESTKAADAAFRLYMTLARLLKIADSGNSLSSAHKKQKAEDEAYFLEHFSTLAKAHAESVKRMSDSVAHRAGLIRKDALASRQGRELLRTQRMANRAEVKQALLDALRAGERRGQKNAKGLKSIHLRVCAKMGRMVRKAYLNLLSVSLRNKDERSEMRDALHEAMRFAVEVATSNLEVAIRTAVTTSRNIVTHRNLDKHKGASVLVSDAVSGLQRALLVLTESQIKTKDTDKSVTAASEAMKKVVLKVKSKMPLLVATALEKVSQKQSVNSKAVAKVLRQMLTAALQQADARYTEVYLQMAKDRSVSEKKLYKDAIGLGRAHLLHLAMASVQDASPEKLARVQEDLKRATKAFRGSMISLMAKVRAIESRLIGEGAVVSGEAISHTKSKIRVNRRVTISVGRLVNLAVQKLTSKKSKAKEPAVLTEDRRVEAANLLAKEAVATKKGVDQHHESVEVSRVELARGVSLGTRSYYTQLAMSQHKHSQPALVLEGRHAYLKETVTSHHVKAAQQRMDNEITMLTNGILADAPLTLQKLQKITGLSTRTAAATDTEKTCVKQLQGAMQDDLVSAAVAAVTLGEAQAKQEDDRLRARLTIHRQELQEILSQKVERAADQAFQAANSGRELLARNYLSLKTYIAEAQPKFQDVLAGEGGTKVMSSLADVLMSISARVGAKLPPSFGGFLGADKMPSLFGGKGVATHAKAGVEEALAGEYARVISEARLRWPGGIGKYILGKLEASMQKRKGVLLTQRDLDGPMVYIDGDAIGLSGQVNMLKDLGVRLHHFQLRMQKLSYGDKVKPTLPLSGKPQVPPPEWKGDA